MRIPKDPAAETPLEGLEGYYEEFFQSRLSDVGMLEVALKAGNYEEILIISHKWKGFSAPYGFGILSEIALELDDGAGGNNFAVCQDLILEARDYLLNVKKRDDSK